MMMLEKKLFLYNLLIIIMQKKKKIIELNIIKVYWSDLINFNKVIKLKFKIAKNDVNLS